MSTPTPVPAVHDLLIKLTHVRTALGNLLTALDTEAPLADATLHTAFTECRRLAGSLHAWQPEDAGLMRDYADGLQRLLGRAPQTAADRAELWRETAFVLGIVHGVGTDLWSLDRPRRRPERAPGRRR